MKSLPVRERLHLARDGSLSPSRFVRCPDDGHWSTLDSCRRCSRCAEAVEGAVYCASALSSACADDPALAPITDVMEACVVCVDGGATVESALYVMGQRDAPIAVVLDDHRHPVGVCSRRELREADAAQLVSEEMTPFVITMLEKSTVADAMHLIAERDLHHIPILSHGHIVGTVTPRAVILWLAQKLRAAQERSLPASVLGPTAP